MRGIIGLTTYVFSILHLLPFNQVTASEPCWINLTSWYGTFHSPNQPRNYSPNVDCYWLITVATGNTIRMTLNDFSVEQSLRCQKGYIAVHDGPTESSPLIKTRFCGTSLSSDQRFILSRRNVMLVHMHSDSGEEYRGFNASYQGVCHVIITSPFEEISSPYFPGLQTEEAMCNWLIDVGDGYYIIIHISAVLSHNNTDCKSNYIKIQEGQVSYSTALTICGEVNTTSITTKSPTRILFAKERNQTFEFKAHYNTIDIDECSNRALGAFPCHQNAICINNNNGSFTCACKEGYVGDGKNCSDSNECLMQSPCHANARCINTNGSFTCECHKGYTGSGIYCHDINECMEKTHTCRPGSICINKEGSYTCPCRDGFYFDRETTKCLPDAVVLNEPEQSNLSLSPEIIAGIVTTIILLLAVIVGGFFYWKRSRNVSTCGSEDQDTSKYGRNTNTMMVSQSYEFCNLSFSSMESGPKRSFDAVTAAGYPARLNGDVEDYCSDSIVIKSHNQHEMTSQKSTRLQTLDEELESIDV